MELLKSWCQEGKNQEQHDNNNSCNHSIDKELQSRGERHRPLHPDQDVDSAFNFLETYSVREEEGDGRRGYSLYLSSQKEESIEGLPSIPR